MPARNSLLAIHGSKSRAYGVYKGVASVNTANVQATIIPNRVRDLQAITLPGIASKAAVPTPPMDIPETRSATKPQITLWERIAFRSLLTRIASRKHVAGDNRLSQPSNQSTIWA